MRYLKKNAKQTDMEKFYETPVIETVEINVEKGFGTSGETEGFARDPEQPW